MIAFADERNTGGDQAARQFLAARDAQAPRARVGRVDERAVAFLGPEQFVGDRLVDDAGDDLAVALERQRDREVRHAVQEIRRAIERIGDPAIMAVAPIGALHLAAFLAEETVFGARAFELLAKRALGHDVGAAHEIAGAFFRNLELLDFAEIAL